MWVSALRKSLDITFCVNCRVKMHCWHDHNQIQDAVILNVTDPWQRQGLPLVQKYRCWQCIQKVLPATSSVWMAAAWHWPPTDTHPIQIGCQLLVPVGYNKYAEFSGDSAASSSEELTHPVPLFLCVCLSFLQALSPESSQVLIPIACGSLGFFFIFLDSEDQLFIFPLTENTWSFIPFLRMQHSCIFVLKKRKKKRNKSFWI